MKGYISNIEKSTIDNVYFRKVLYTTTQSQLVLMSLLPGEEIGEEIHDVDQFLRIEQGIGMAVLDGVPYPISDGSAVVVPLGTKHNIVNTGKNSMKLYSLYMPPHHRDGVVHETKAQAESDEEHFEGVTSV